MVGEYRRNPWQEAEDLMAAYKRSQQPSLRELQRRRAEIRLRPRGCAAILAIPLALIVLVVLLSLVGGGR